MDTKKRFFWVLISFGIVLLCILLLQPLEILFEGNIAMLYPKGIIALRERNLLFLLQGLMFIVVIPVFFFAFYFAWKYRAGNLKNPYKPDLNENRLAEFIWWGVPILLVTALSTITWILCVYLDPYRPIESDKKPLKIQVVALDWKWLFIYPEQHIASVNYFRIPVDTPVEFSITSDAPMNGFWIPQLGSQIYAMPKMRTKLNLIANEVGDYRGSSSNLSGSGFAGMHFIANASEEEAFHQWIDEAKKSSHLLNVNSYKELAQPSERHPVTLYKLEDEDLFEWIIMKYKTPHEVK